MLALNAVESRTWCKFLYWINFQIFFRSSVYSIDLKRSLVFMAKSHHQQCLLRFKPISMLPAGLAALNDPPHLNVELLCGCKHSRNRKLCLKINKVKSESGRGLIKNIGSRPCSCLSVPFVYHCL